MALPAKPKQRREVIGPVLYFRGIQNDRWRLSALLVLSGDAEPPDMAVDGVLLPVPPRHLHCQGDHHIWRWDFAVPRGDFDSRIGYGFPGRDRWYLTVPGRGSPPRMAYVACNGVEDEALLKELNLPRNARWGHLNGVHRSEPFHLLFQGGDQLYADGLWRDCATFREWLAKPARERWACPFTPEMAAEADAFFFQRYCALWRYAEIAAVLSTVPSIMMWDDHDIFDGWGSHPEDRRCSPVYQGIYAAARRHFALFQLGLTPDDLPDCFWGARAGNFAQGFKVGEIGILVLDLRSERTQSRVLSEATWAELPGWLDRLSGCCQLLVMSSVPMVFANLHAVEKIMNIWPGQAKLEDDLRDQWRSYVHQDEWQRLLDLLGAFSGHTGAAVTVLSGEVHLGHAGVVRGPGYRIMQLTSSGIVHPPPPKMFIEVLERLARGTEQIRDGSTLELPVFPETGKRFIRARNWLALTCDEKAAITAQWHVEGEKVPFALQIKPS
jgi:hypothetical protein